MVAQFEYQERVKAEAMAEYLADDRVAQNITYRRFVSRSKGRRKGKQRIRRNLKEIHLVKYHDGYHLWHRFPFDECATEILDEWADGELLKQKIEELWGF